VWLALFRALTLAVSARDALFPLSPLELNQAHTLSGKVLGSCVPPVAFVQNLSLTQSFPRRPRYELLHRQIVTAILDAKANNQLAEAKRLSSKYATHPVYPAFHDLGVVDIHEKMTHEKLHNNSLGVTRLVLRVLQLHIKANFKTRFNAITLELNIRMQEMDK